MRRSLLWGIALALTAGVGYVTVDATQRVTTLGTFTQGMGTLDNPSREAVWVAEWNLVYLFGLAIGSVSGIGSMVVAGLGWHLLRVRRSDIEPSIAVDSGDV